MGGEDDAAWLPLVQEDVPGPLRPIQADIQEEEEDENAWLPQVVRFMGVPGRKLSVSFQR